MRCLRARSGGAQFLAGFPETSFMFGLICALFFLWLMARDFSKSGDIKRSLLLAVVTGSVALALSAFQLAEFVTFLAASYTVHTESYGTVVKEPFWLLPLFLPNFFGTPFVSFWIAGISPYDHMPSSLFCGISTVFLAIKVLLWRAAPNRNYVLLFVALFVVFAGYDYGFPILKYVGHFPIMNLMSTVWSAFVIPFALSVLAGFGRCFLSGPARIRGWPQFGNLSCELCVSRRGD